MVLLAYRGTDPFDISTWAADADVHPVMIPVPGGDPSPEGLKEKILGALGHDRAPQVHGGFYRSQRATWFDVLQGLKRALAGESILVGEAHSSPDAAPASSDPRDETPTSPLEALYVCEKCFGPLEVAYDHSRWNRDVGEARRRIQGGPQNIWRYAEFLPLAGGPPGPSGRLASRLP